MTVHPSNNAVNANDPTSTSFTPGALCLPRTVSAGGSRPQLCFASRVPRVCLGRALGVLLVSSDVPRWGVENRIRSVEIRRGVDGVGETRLFLRCRAMAQTRKNVPLPKLCHCKNCRSIVVPSSHNAMCLFSSGC